MNDDELIESLRRTLRSRAAAVTPSPAPVEPRSPAKAPRRTWPGLTRPWSLVGAGVLAGGAAAAIGIAVGLSSPNHHVSITPGSNPTVSIAPPTTTAPVPTTRPVPTTAVTSSPKPVPAGFKPISVTFVGPAMGWALGTAPCATGSCAALARTYDGGDTWSAATAPAVRPDPAQPTGTWVRFYNQRYGWIVSTAAGGGASRMWYSQDGGASWQDVATPGGGSAAVMALETSGTAVDAVVLFTGSTKQLIYTSPVDHLDWQPAPTSLLVGAGPVPMIQMDLAGSSGWIIDTDRTTIGGAVLTHGTWGQWTPPCSTANGTGLLASASASDLYAVCNEGTWGPSADKLYGPWLYLSTDGGTTFSRVAPLPSGTQVTSLTSAAGNPQTVVAGTSTGLVASFDGGHSWQTVHASPSSHQITFVGFTTISQGVAVEQSYDGTDSSLLMTVDGGHTWSAVRF